MTKKKKGYFITLEGIEGCGKSTQLKNIARYFKQEKRPYIIVREPGGTKIGEKIRNILLDKKNTAMSHETEALLYCAARAQIVNEVIIPALHKGISVICDRFYDSTLAYQGYGLGMKMRTVTDLCVFASSGLVPDITILLDLPVTVGLKRAGRTDRIEGRSLSYHRKVRNGFLDLAQRNKKRFFVLNGTHAIDAVKKEIKGILDHAIK